MDHLKITRRTAMTTAAGAAMLGSKAFAQIPLPKSPITLSVLDATGALAYTQPMFDDYAKEKPQLVSRFTFTRSPSQEMHGKIKAQQAANRVDIDLVMCGNISVAIGNQDNTWRQLVPEHAKSLPNLDEILHEGAQVYQKLGKGNAIPIGWTVFGPLLTYLPQRVKTPPKTAEELLQWTKENKNRFIYARPISSGPANAFVCGLPYILGNSNPKDPMKGWDKTWAYLKALNENIEYYPPGTAPAIKEFGEGSRDLMPTTAGFDINARALGIVPKEAQIATIKGFHWIPEANFMCIPRGLPEDRVAVVLDLMSFMLTKKQQAHTWDKGYVFPGPVVKDVPLEMASAESQATLKEFGRPEYADLIANNPKTTPLAPDDLAAAFRRWDQEIGSAKK